MHAPDHEFIVQMRARDAAGAAEQAYGLALLHSLPLVDGALGRCRYLVT